MPTATPTKKSPAVPHPSVAERAAHGKAARAEVPRSSQGKFEPAARRPDPIKLLERQAKTRVPELVPLAPPAVVVAVLRKPREKGVVTVPIATSESQRARATLSALQRRFG
jgi:hypothetical protein